MRPLTFWPSKAASPGEFMPTRVPVRPGGRGSRFSKRASANSRKRERARLRSVAQRKQRAFTAAKS
jgi:hypothetical protein